MQTGAAALPEVGVVVMDRRIRWSSEGFSSAALLTAVLTVAACSGSTDATPTPTPTDPDNRCAVIEASVVDAGFSADVTVECDETYAWLESDTYPDHTLMTGILRTNLQIAVPALDHRIAIPLNPVLSENVTTIDNAVGVAINGVPMYDYSSQGTLDPAEYDPAVDTIVQGELDRCGGHAGRGDDYHYHASPTCMLEMIPNLSDATIIGWAFDGFPLYSERNPDGTEIASGELDVCNGQVDAAFGYRYHTSSAPPYTIQCLVGAVDLSVHSPIPPLEGDDGKARPLGALPDGREPVDDLTFTESDTGERLMTFSQSGDDFSISYKPGTVAGCYDFVISTLGASPSTGTYCR